MSRLRALFASVSIFAACGCAESLTYSINYTSGLSLGEATLNSTKSGDPAKWSFSLKLDAGIPGFTVRDQYTSRADAGLCSQVLEKDLSHGSKKVKEKITFDQQKHEVKRETQGGGSSESSVGMCARDALAFLQFVRQELQQSRLAPQQSIVFGGQYQVRFEYMGVQRIQNGSSATEAERIQTTIKGPSSNFTVEIFFGRDAARTPILARIPLSLGQVTVELVQ